MRRIHLCFPLFLLVFPLFILGQGSSNSFPVYTGNDLGLTWQHDTFTIKIWAPLADSVLVYLYKKEQEQDPFVVSLQQGNKGVWTYRQHKKSGFLFYQIQAKNKVDPHTSHWSKRVTDPYAIAVSQNGIYAAILDVAAINPTGWELDHYPLPSQSPVSVIYELNIRDASMHASSGIINKGKYTGLTELGTKNPAGLSTGLDHISELGVTHVHLLPFFDFKSSDESLRNPPYNWGYDPFHYNAPEGIYASESKNPATRVLELKKMIQAFHQKGLKVVMDVVYNHTAQLESASFEQLVPGYYYRKKSNGQFSNASACGNETASEQPMFRQFMLQSLAYWIKNYHVDGFRFDLMGIHDIETMNRLSDSLRKLNPSLLLYGEGWTAGDSPLPAQKRAIKANVTQLHTIAVFGDEFRDGIKGSVFEPKQPGYVNGDVSTIPSILFGLVGGVSHPAIDFSKVKYTHQPLTNSPQQLIAYADCHDNHTLWDRLALSAPTSSVDARIAMQKMALTLVLTSQSQSFLHAGSEFLRTKHGVENSFQSSDSINAINWNDKALHADVYNYVKEMIAIKKMHPAFRVADPIHSIQFAVDTATGVIGYFIDAHKTTDPWRTVQVWFNPSDNSLKILPTSQFSRAEEHHYMIMQEYRFTSTPMRINKDAPLRLPPHSSLLIASW
jgi:pullulanase